MPFDAIGRPAGVIDVLADQVAVDAGHEIVGDEIDVFNLAVEFGGEVIAQPFGIHPYVDVAQRGYSGSPAFRHFFPVDGNEPVQFDSFSSEERCVGKECVSTYRSWWEQNHE